MITEGGPPVVVHMKAMRHVDVEPFTRCLKDFVKSTVELPRDFIGYMPIFIAYVFSITLL